MEKKKQVKKNQEKIVLEKTFLYLVPDSVKADGIAKALEDAGFAAKQMEVWKEINLLELNLESGSLYMEDFQDSLQKEDEALLTGLGQKYVYAVSYPETESSAVKHMMEKLLSVFGGKLASDTEDFTQFLTVGEL